MSVLIDTSVWSLALRRRSGPLSASERRVVEEWAALVREGRVALIGPIRQEVLSGIREEVPFESLRKRLAEFGDIPLDRHDFEAAANAFNRCRRVGVTGSAIDLLICAAAIRRDIPIFTEDADFHRYAKHLPIRLHRPRRVGE